LNLKSYFQRLELNILRVYFGEQDGQSIKVIKDKIGFRSSTFWTEQERARVLVWGMHVDEITKICLPTILFFHRLWVENIA